MPVERTQCVDTIPLLPRPGVETIESRLGPGVRHCVSSGRSLGPSYYYDRRCNGPCFSPSFHTVEVPTVVLQRVRDSTDSFYKSTYRPRRPQTTYRRTHDQGRCLPRPSASCTISLLFSPEVPVDSFVSPTTRLYCPSPFSSDTHRPTSLRGWWDFRNYTRDLRDH